MVLSPLADESSWCLPSARRQHAQAASTRPRTHKVEAQIVSIRQAPTNNNNNSVVFIEWTDGTNVHVLKCNKITCKLLAPNLKLFSISNVRQSSREHFLATLAALTQKASILETFVRRNALRSISPITMANNEKQIGPVNFFIFIVIWHLIKILKWNPFWSVQQTSNRHACNTKISWRRRYYAIKDKP